MACFLRPTLGETAKTSVVASFDEAVGDGLLLEWAQTIEASDDATLTLIGDRPASEMLAAAEQLVASLEDEHGADVALLPVANGEVERLADEADFLYTRRPAERPLDKLPRIASACELHAARAARRARAVFVVGMHRSGTSAMARVVDLVGVPLGVPEELLPPRPDNPTGFWESRVLARLNEALLAGFGATALEPPVLASGWERDAALGEFRWEGCDRLKAAFARREWAVKDPRLCITLPFWLAGLDVEPVAVMPYRNPLEVAASLAARDGIPVATALDLWERYVRASLDATRGLPLTLHSYESLLERPAALVRKLRAFLRTHGFTVNDESIAIDSVTAFAQDGLRHHRHDIDELRRVATPEQVELYERLMSLEGED